MRQTGRLALYGTLNGALVGVPAYSLQRVQSCVTKSKLLLCLFLQRGSVDVLPTTSEGNQHNDFSAAAQTADCLQCVCQWPQSLSG